MKKLPIILIVCVLMFSGTNLKAQTEWTLEKCIDYALEHNIQVKRQTLQTQVSNNYLIQSKLELLPNLNAGADHNLSSGRSLNEETYRWENRELQQGSLGLASSVTLFNGMRNYNTIQLRKFDMMRSLSELDKVKQNITMNIATAYLQILFNYELLEIAKNQLEVTMLQAKKIERLVEVGNTARGELLEIMAQAANEKLNVTLAENNLNISYLTLTQMLDLDSIGDFRIIKPGEIMIGTDLNLLEINEIYGQSLGLMPIIRSAEHGLSVSEKELAIARGRRSPEISLRGNYYSRYNELAVNPITPSAEYPYRDQLNDNQYKQLTLSLSIPIFNRFHTETAIKNARIGLLDAKYNLEQSKQILYKDIQQAHADAINSLEKYKSASEAVKSNQESFAYTDQKFTVGLVSSVDYFVAKNMLTKAISDQLQSKYEFLFKTKILDFYMGYPITL